MVDRNHLVLASGKLVLQKNCFNVNCETWQSLVFPKLTVPIVVQSESNVIQLKSSLMWNTLSPTTLSEAFDPFDLRFEHISDLDGEKLEARDILGISYHCSGFCTKR